MNNSSFYSADNSLLHERMAYLEKCIIEMKTFLSNAPEGNLVCRDVGDNVFRYYRNNNEKQTYLSVSEKENVKLLALKKMYKTVLSFAEKELKALSKTAGKYGLFENSMADFFKNNPGCKKLIQGWDEEEKHEPDVLIRSWESEKYRKNPLYPEYLIHETIKGEKVRSKSEASIADVLFLCGIPYRYECELKIGNEMFYPDFMIMDPMTGDIFIWEHFGLIDMDKYLMRTANKLKAYTAAGYFPNRTLIITSEDAEHPFTGAQAAEIVSKFFNRSIMSNK